MPSPSTIGTLARVIEQITAQIDRNTEAHAAMLRYYQGAPEQEIQRLHEGHAARQRLLKGDRENLRALLRRLEEGRSA